MSYYLIGLGSNIQPENNITTACKEIAPYVNIIDCSPVLINPPCGHTFQFTFHNQILLVNSLHSALELKTLFETIEVKMGREPKNPQRRFKDRTIDIDILAQADTIQHVLSTKLEESYNQTIMKNWALT